MNYSKNSYSYIIQTFILNYAVLSCHFKKMKTHLSISYGKGLYVFNIQTKHLLL